MEDILVPIFICCVMPVSIVLIVYWRIINAENKRAQVLLEAIKANNGIDADKLAAAMQQQQKTPLQVLQGRLLKGCIFSLIGLVLIAFAFYLGFADEAAEGVPGVFGGISLAVGISYLVVYFVTRKSVVCTAQK